MPVGLSRKTAPILKPKSFAISSTCLNLSRLFGSTNAANLGAIPLTTRSVSPCEFRQD